MILLLCAILTLSDYGAGMLPVRRQYGMAVVEGDITFTQNVTEVGDDLMMIEVPHHHQLEHIVVFIDKKNNYELIKYVERGKCQLSQLPSVVEENVDQQQKQMFKRSDSLVIRSDAAQRINITKLESATPLSNTLFLRHELLEACGTWPIFWAESILETDMQDMIKDNKIFQNDDYILKPVYPQTIRNGGSCNEDPAGSEIPLDPNLFICQSKCNYMKCKVQSNGCYYFISCPLDQYNYYTKRCEHHIATGNQICKPCCMDPRAPGGPETNVKCTLGHFMHHCDCQLR